MTDPVVTPAKKVQKYRNHSIQLQYIPMDHVWNWSFEHHHTIPFSGNARSMKAALAASQKIIDNLLDGK